jgi:glycerophosphoryl diester phosphodiesterase
MFTMIRLALLILYFAQAAFSVEIIAHRGASFDAPENTLAAMKLAWEQNADAIELDLWLSKDGRLVVFHDADAKRIAGVPRKIADLTWDEVKDLDVGAWKSPQFKGERIPTLESILATIPKGRRAVLEIKCGPEIVPELKRVLDASKRPARELAIISFNFDSLKKCRETFPDLEHYFLHGYKKDPATGMFHELKPLIARAQAAKFHGLNLNFEWPIDEQFVREVKGAGLKMLVWTVNDAAVAKRLVSVGVDAITTDRPAWLREQLK